MIYQDSLSIEIGSGRNLSQGRHVLSRPVLACGIGLSGYSARLLGSDDDHLGMLSILLDAKVTPDDRNAVEITIDIEVRDVDLSARYNALIEFVVFAELEPVGALVPGEPRPDMVVSGVEFNQAIQAFRSSEHLAIQFAMPDNAIPLIEGKPTCARVYVDYDVTSPHPVSPISGTLTVRNGDQEITVSPVSFANVDDSAISPAPAAEITPTADGVRSRQLADRTLNFLIPTTLCAGNPTFRVNLVLTGRPGEFLREFQTEAAFVRTTPPPIHLVGVRYTGPNDGPDAVANASAFYPSASACRDAMKFANRLFPMAPITSSYDTMDWDETPNPDKDVLPCKSLGGVLDGLSDLLGDQPGVIIGFMPEGYPKAGGCGRPGVCAGRIPGDGVIAHEFGHALGFKHAPCQPGECNPLPKNADDSYPHYQPYAIGSIGEYGVEIIDGATITLRTPQRSRELLGYAKPRWITPYTYLRAFNQWSPTYISPTTVSPRSLTIAALDKREHLFLDIEIARSRRVTLAPTFHFPIGSRPPVGRATSFSVELSDAEGQVLKSSPVYDASDEDDGSGCCGPSEWPKRYRHPIPYDVRATKLSVYECDELIHEACIPRAPVVEVKATGHDDECSPHVVLEWSVERPEGCGCEDMIFVVQVQVDDGNWAGVAPRSSKPFLIIDKTRLLDSLKLTRLRVLASSGVATGVGHWEQAIAYKPCGSDRPVRTRRKAQTDD